MKTKRYLKGKSKVIYAAIGLILVAAIIGGGYYLSEKKGQELNKNKTNSTATVSQQDQKNAAGKGQTQTTTPKAVTTTPAPAETTPSTSTSTGLALLEGVSIQALRDSDTQTLSLSLYGPEGTYDVDKCSNYQSGQCLSGWSALITDQAYAGFGGLTLEQWPATETSATYVAYKLVSGSKVSESNPITVVASQVTVTKTFSEAE
jgi:hypothetical protein